MMPEKSVARAAGGVEQRVKLRGVRRRAAYWRRWRARPPARASDPSASARRRSRACSRCWRARPAPGRAPGNSSSATSSGPTRSRRRRTAPARERPSFSPSTNASQVAIIVAPRIMLLQIFGRLPRAGAAAMDDALAHRFEDRLGGGEGVVRAAAHEGQRRRPSRRRRRRRPAHRPKARPSPAAIVCALRALSTSMVEESIHSAPGLAGKARPDAEHMLAGRQHGHDDVGRLRPPPRALVGDLDARRRRRLAQFRRRDRSRARYGRP